MKKLPAPERVEKVQSKPKAPLTDRQREVLQAMFVHERNEPLHGMTGNQVGSALGFRSGDAMVRRGPAVKAMGPAQKVIGSMIGLERRDLIRFASRRDGRTGTAYRLTDDGKQKAREIMAEKATEKGYRTDLHESGWRGDPEAVWIVEGYDPENLEPVAASKVEFMPGNDVEINDDHEIYGGETGEVQAAGIGTGIYAGRVMYDVRVEGAVEVERFSGDELGG